MPSNPVDPNITFVFVVATVAPAILYLVWRSFQYNRWAFTDLLFFLYMSSLGFLDHAWGNEYPTEKHLIGLMFLSFIMIVALMILRMQYDEMRMG